MKTPIFTAPSGEQYWQIAHNQFATLTPNGRIRRVNACDLHMHLIGPKGRLICVTPYWCREGAGMEASF